MKKSLRIASAALALTLAASCAVPAFAAGSSSFSKDETVYAVMNGDGSLKSTTVSEHLYNAGGLSSVTDKSTLTDIQNTESSAEFTQNGDELVWNTDDTDVYYKGSTDKTLPMDVKVTYALDGQEAALEDLIGKSGHPVHVSAIDLLQIIKIQFTDIFAGITDTAKILIPVVLMEPGKHRAALFQ